MRKAVLLLVLGAGLLLAAGCGGDDDDGGEAAGGTTTTAEASCDKGSLDLVNAGQLTIGTDNPAFPPWVEGTKEFRRPTGSTGDRRAGSACRPA